jgi:hypothetical protein
VRFDERWISDEQLALTAELAAQTAGLPGEVIEIGTWQGLSAIPIANAVHPAVLHVVDHWLGDEPEALATVGGISPEFAAARDNYGIFLANVAEGTAGNVKVHKMGWREFAADWAEPVRFLHLDASHSRKELSDSIAALLPFAVPGAVFAGDDWNHPPDTQAAVREHFTDVNARFNMWWVVL